LLASYKLVIAFCDQVLWEVEMPNPTGVDRSAKFVPVWVVVMVISGILLMTAGAVIALLKPAMLVSPGDPISAAVKVYAGYLVSRNLAVALALLAALLLRDRRALTILMILTALIQLFDTGLDIVEGRWALVPGVLVFALVYLAGAHRISEGPLWRLGVRREIH